MLDQKPHRPALIPCLVLTGCLFAASAPGQRAAWNSSQLKGTPDPPPPLVTERIYADVSFDQPIAVRDLPQRNRRVLLLRRGDLVTIASAPDARQVDLAFSISEALAKPAGEKVAAARDMALDPNFAVNGFVYVMWHIQPMHQAGGSRITRLTFDQADPPRIIPNSRLDIVRYHSGDHVGASLRFGPSGYLWVTTGDGARPYPPDTFKTAQDLTDLRGSVLRLDVSNANAQRPYRVPDDNPFIGNPEARPEIYAFGLRNGFRSTFKPGTSELWVADVGWERCEMIHRIQPGGNHGWSLYEGPHPVDLEQAPGPGAVIAPAIALPRSEAQSITGGPFLPDTTRLIRDGQTLAGRLIFGCYMNGNVWAADIEPGEAPSIHLIASTGLRLIDFCVSSLPDTPSGQTELLALDFGGGGLYRLIPNESTSGIDDFPRKLSETGLYEDLSRLMPAEGVIAYEPAS
ncbi:MAG: PQQ-dependent sugar dehydrogenase, partial [Planctomycetota bacterium]